MINDNFVTEKQCAEIERQRSVGFSSLTDDLCATLRQFAEALEMESGRRYGGKRHNPSCVCVTCYLLRRWRGEE